MLNLTPIKFIDTLRASDPYIETIYMNGGCYQFHLVLKAFWPDAVPCINTDKDHVATWIDGRFYDISGDAPGAYYGMNKEDIAEAEKWTFAKYMVLSIGECEHCEEPILIGARDQKAIFVLMEHTQDWGVSDSIGYHTNEYLLQAKAILMEWTHYKKRKKAHSSHICKVLSPDETKDRHYWIDKCEFLD